MDIDMNAPSPQHEDDEHEDDFDDYYIDENDILQEINVDELEHVDSDEDEQGGGGFIDETDDSVHTFMGQFTREAPYVLSRLYDNFCWAATGGLDNKLIIWDLQRSAPRCTCKHEDGVTCLLWLGQHRCVATGCVDGKVRIWDSLSGECVRTFSGHTDAIQSLAASSNGEYLVSGSLDKTACVFEIAEFN